MKKIVVFLMLAILVTCTTGCLEQKFPHGKQVKPDNVEGGDGGH